jgi:hypothetical protein
VKDKVNEEEGKLTTNNKKGKKRKQRTRVNQEGKKEARNLNV